MADIQDILRQIEAACESRTMSKSTTRAIELIMTLLTILLAREELLPVEVEEDDEEEGFDIASLTIDEVKEVVAGIGSIDELDELLVEEASNDGGRKGALKAIEDRIRELEASREEEE